LGMKLRGGLMIGHLLFFSMVAIEFGYIQPHSVPVYSSS
jgi:hypothetical protein